MPAIQNITSDVLSLKGLGDILPAQVLTNVPQERLTQKEVMEAISFGKLKIVGNTVSRKRNGPSTKPNRDSYNTLFHYCKNSLEIQKVMLRELQRNNELLEKLLEKDTEVVLTAPPPQQHTPQIRQEDQQHAVVQENQVYIPKLNTDAQVQLNDNTSSSSADKTQKAREKLRQLRQLKGKNDG